MAGSLTDYFNLFYIPYLEILRINEFLFICVSKDQLITDFLKISFNK